MALYLHVYIMYTMSRVDADLQYAWMKPFWKSMICASWEQINRVFISNKIKGKERFGLHWLCGTVQ